MYLSLDCGNFHAGWRPLSRWSRRCCSFQGLGHTRSSHAWIPRDWVSFSPWLYVRVLSLLVLHSSVSIGQGFYNHRTMFSRLIGYFFLFLTGKKTDSLQTSNVWWSLDNTIHLIVQPAKHHLLIVMIHNIIGMAFTKSSANQQFEQLIINIHHSHTYITHLTNW